MGLQFYRNPEDIDAENAAAAAAKLDRATGQRRSAIRREPTIRPRRDPSAFSVMNAIARSRHEVQQLQSRLNRDNTEADAQIAHLEAELQTLRRQRERTMIRMERHRAILESDSARSLERPTEPRNTTTPEDPTLTLQQDAVPDADQLGTVLLPRPARESNLRFEMAAMPSPPRSVGDSGRSRPVDGPLDDWDAEPSLSRDFAPARLAREAIDLANATLAVTRDAPSLSGDSEPVRRARAALDRVNATIAAARESIRESMSTEEPGLETPPPETWENSYPPLRRVPHMSPRPLPRTSVDGLGDRHRSPSPHSETHEESTWNNLLSTMEHSNEASSTSTSFASMTDLMAASRSSSYRSSNTTNTSTSFGEIGTSSEETCDLPPGITEDDVRMIRERHRRTARRLPRRRITERDHDNEELGLSPDLLRSGSVGGTESDMSRLLMDHVAQRLQHRDEPDSETSLRAEAVHDILERMQRREHIPDDAWAVAGLSPDYFSRS